MKRPGILIVALWLGLSTGGFAQTLSVGASFGLFFPESETYRSVYGQSLPFDLEVRLGLSRYLGLTAGVGYIADSGQAINRNQGQDSYPVRFRMVSFPFSVYFLVPLDGFSLFAGAGMSVHSFEEEWQTVPLSHTGDSTKPMVYAGAEYRFLERLAARLTLRYETISAGRNPFLADEINLGGLTVLAGVTVRIF
jgi:opacity protein-like surface antigen